MEKFHPVLLALAAASLVCFGAGGSGARAQIKLEFIEARCLSGDDIAIDTRRLLEDTALRFVQTMLGEDPRAAHAAFTAEFALSADQFAKMVQQNIQPRGPFRNVRVTHTHLVEITAGGYDSHGVCGSVSPPEERFTVAIKPVPQQAHVIVEADNINNGWAFVLWLIPEPIWRVYYLQFAMAEMVGKSAQDIWDLDPNGVAGVHRTVTNRRLQRGWVLRL